MNKKIYVIDRNGRMHQIALDVTLTINGTAILTVEDAETILSNLFENRNDITFKTATHLKVFDATQLIGFQVIPENE